MVFFARRALAAVAAAAVVQGEVYKGEFETTAVVPKGPLGPKGSNDYRAFDKACDIKSVQPLVNKTRRRVDAIAQRVAGLSFPPGNAMLAGEFWRRWLAGQRQTKDMLSKATGVFKDLKGTAPADLAKTLLLLTTACSDSNLRYLRCWPGALRRAAGSRVGEADVLLYAARGGQKTRDFTRAMLEKDAAKWAGALAQLPNRNVSLAWTRWNPGFHKGSLVFLALGVQRGWFGAYEWVVRSSLDVSLLDPAPLEAKLADARVQAVLFTCSRDGQEIRMPVPLQGGHICADFFAVRPGDINAAAIEKGTYAGYFNAAASLVFVFYPALAQGNVVLWSKDVHGVKPERACRVRSYGLFHDHRHCAEGNVPEKKIKIGTPFGAPDSQGFRMEQAPDHQLRRGAGGPAAARRRSQRP